jgi:NAD(P)-dependent dehydrogenase (short-subunit alcohol dehydrogenase family)
MRENFLSNKPLEKRIAVVTGSNRGIGLAISRALAAHGAQVVITGRHRKALDAARRELPNALAVRADVTRPAEVLRLFRVIRRRFGRLDILVNNAGVFTYKPFVRTTLADWRANLEANLTSVFLATQAALPLLKRSSRAHVVNILSISALRAFPKCSAYAASKFGALGLTRVLGQELRSEGIRVTAVLPGATDTRMVEEFDFPVHRERLLQPDDVAAVVVAALTAPARARVEEIHLTPSAGRL